MTLGMTAGREHAPSRLDAAELDVERDEPRAVHRGTGRDPLTLELARSTMQQLEPLGSIPLVTFVVERHVSRTEGRHAGAIRGRGRVFKRRAALPIA
jgi:hypothetical protein